MKRYRLTRRASDDVHDIFAYGLVQFGERQAEDYADGLERLFDLLGSHREMGRRADSIAPGVRRHEYRSQVILYRLTEGGVLILAVVHGRSVRRLSL